MKNALIIFVRNAELGKVKTRLAAQIGNKKTLEIYIKLLQHTRQVAVHADCDKFIFTTEPLQDNTWKDFKVEHQANGDLGEKMLHAFNNIFEKGYEKVVIIGSDCPDLSSPIINKAFEKLVKNDIVIGPAEDGGYYLLGMKKLYPDILKNKNWSTSSVFNDTVETINNLDLTFYQLVTLADVDEEKDIPEGWR